MKVKVILAIIAAFAVGFAAASWLPSVVQPEADQALSIEGRTGLGAAPGTLVAQGDLGFRCATADGICGLPVPQPIGSVCYCNGVEGTTVR